MITIKKPEIKIESPKEFNWWNVMFWEPKSKELLKLKQNGDKTSATLLTKAKQFLEEECIIKTEDGFICKPIEGYNKTTYNIRNLICDCQGFQIKLKTGKGFCSHVLAVKQFKFIETFK